MPITDLLKPEPPAPTAPVTRPDGITCEKYAPGIGKRCVSYLENGACSRPDELMCVEWLKRNAQPRDDAPASSMSIGPVTPALKEGQLLTREDAESFKRLGVEVELRSPLGTFWLVPSRTGSDRMELTIDEATTIANVVHVFGGRIISFTRDGKPLPDANPASVAEAESLLSESESDQTDRRAEAPVVWPAGQSGGPRDLSGPVVAPSTTVEEPSPDDARAHLRRLRDGGATTQRPVPAQTNLFDPKDGAR